MVTALGGQKARQSDPTRRPAREHRDRWLKTQIQRVLCAGEEPQEVGTPSCAKTQLCSAESRSSVDCALRLTSAAGLAGLVPSESLAP